MSVPSRPWLTRALALVAAAGLLALAGATGAQAAEAGRPVPALPEPLTPEAVRELVARLDEAEVRQLLIAQLDRAAAPAVRSGRDLMGMVDGVEEHTPRMRARAGEIARGALALPRALGEARHRFLEGRGAGHLLVALLGLLVVLAVGGVAEALYRRAVRGPRQALAAASGAGLGPAAGRLALRLVLDLLGLAVFAGAGLLAFFAAYQGHAPTRRLVLTTLAAVVLVRTVAALSRLLLAPGDPARRLLPLEDGAARRLHGGLVVLAALYAAGSGVIGLLAGLEVPRPTLDALGLALATGFLAIALDLVWRLRGELARLVRGAGEPGPARRLLGDLAPVLATAYLAVVYLSRVGGTLTGAPPSGAPILSIVLLVAVPVVDLALGRALAELLGTGPGRGSPSAAARTTLEPVLRRALHVVVTVLGLLTLAALWDIDLFNLAERGLGGRVAGALLGVAITLLVAWILWELARTAIDRRLDAEAAPVGAAPGEEGGQAASRIRTLLPLLRMSLLAGILVMATLSVLAALGVNILPLLAGAGVFGLAIGFGSQTLVRDVVSGAFYLMDDAFRIGEYIEAGDAKGTVEKIGVRSLHLRHHRGALNVLPYGEIKRLRNNSRDWMILTLEFRLPYDTDLLKVKKVLKQVGEEIAADPELSRDLLQPLKSQGVMATEDSALLVRAKFMARPGSAPYLIRREAYTRILREFRAQGIRFATRQVSVVSASPGAGDAAAAAAALAAPAAPPAT